MRVGDLVRNMNTGLNGVVITMPPPSERYGAILVHWFGYNVEWCARRSLAIVSFSEGEQICK